MALKGKWTDKTDGIDIASAEDINSVAHAVLELEDEIENVSGVYVGSGEMPAGYNVQVDPNGEATLVEVGKTETLSAGSYATVTSTSKDGKVVLDFGIPKGRDGESVADFEYANYNRFIESEVTTDVYLNANGVVTKNASYNMTGYIPCRAGKYVYFSSAIKSSYAFIRGIEFFDADKNRLSFSAVNDATQGGLITFISVKSASYEKTVRCVTQIQDERCHYIRVVFPKDVQSALVIEVRDWHNTDPLDVDYVAGQKIKPPLEKEIPYWRGKKIVWNGDSIPAGYASRAGYPELVELNLSCVTSNHSIGGSTLADDPNTLPLNEDGTKNDKYRNPLVLRYDEMPNDADLVCIAIGTNDWQYGYTEFGDMSSKGTDTFYGALKTLCRGLMRKYLGKPIVFFTPIKRIQEGGYAYWQNNSKGKILADYANAIKEVCGYYGLPVLDLFNECLINPAIEEIKTAYIPDGVHPNIHGHKILARRITGYIEQLADGVF